MQSRLRLAPYPPTTPAGSGARILLPSGVIQHSRRYRTISAISTSSRTMQLRYPLKRDPAGGLIRNIFSRLIRFTSTFGPRGFFGRGLSVDTASVALSMPDGRNGGRGGRSLRRAISSRRISFFSRSSLTSADRTSTRSTRPVTKPRSAFSESVSACSGEGPFGHDGIEA